MIPYRETDYRFPGCDVTHQIQGEQTCVLSVGVQIHPVQCEYLFSRFCRRPWAALLINWLEGVHARPVHFRVFMFAEMITRKTQRMEQLEINYFLLLVKREQ